MYVINNISESLKKPREIMLFFLGPLKSTTDFMEENELYELVEHNERYCYVIYKTKASLLTIENNDGNVI